MIAQQAIDIAQPTQAIFGNVPLVDQIVSRLAGEGQTLFTYTCGLLFLAQALQYETDNIRKDKGVECRSNGTDGEQVAADLAMQPVTLRDDQCL